MALLRGCCALLACVPALAFAQVSAEWNLRLRNEQVDDDAFRQHADATTARLRLGARFTLSDEWSALVEGEGIAAAGAHDDGTNAHRTLPAIIDPAGAELNQAWVAWKRAGVQATLGRQRVVFGNQRWVGNSGWRQNEQTFDALSAQWHVRDRLDVRYAWFDSVHRVAGDRARDPLARERNLSTHAFSLQWAGDATSQWQAFALLHEDQDVRTASTVTTGLRFSTTRPPKTHGPSIAAEYALQRDYADNPLHFAHAYWRIEPAWTFAHATGRLGWEHLGGNGRHALQTPLASLHAFNGWADKFNTTPPGGLEDRWIAVDGAAREGKLEWQVAWHRYDADVGGAYGTESNASLAFPVGTSVKGLVKFADYAADGFAKDTTKVWLQFEWAH
ncbi:alginate export family protein [Noviluteimonas dokdonensis]|uniref:alginate export family protein n=1 Tax=Noviluteimonas dokdonensis TaxID=414050 RepID=UPI0005630A72|nr:alginate export family protein [Lysobacter dokdonensis]